jgi:hypothetical protein
VGAIGAGLFTQVFCAKLERLLIITTKWKRVCCELDLLDDYSTLFRLRFLCCL